MKKLEFNLRTVLVKTIAQADVEFLQTLKFLNFNRSTAKTHVNNLKNSFFHLEQIFQKVLEFVKTFQSI